jgi:O-antigen/teichoic acid export membrane protein
VTIPAYALANVQEGIARSYDWVGLSMMPVYVVRQLLLTVLMGLAYVAGLPMDAVTAMIVTAVSIWLPIIAQFLLVNHRLSGHIAPGPKAYDFKTWLVTALPILMAGGFYSLLAYTDVLVLQHFRAPDEVAVYYAAVKTLALVSFIYYSVSATAAHRFSGYHITGDHAGLSTFISRSIKWTFWPSLAATALLLLFGRPILNLFGPQFTAGYPLMFILAVGLLARAAIGPIERLLNMLGEQRACALIYACAFAVNIGLSFALIPPFGMTGAASATACALLTESILLFVVTRSRLGFHVFVWSRAERRIPMHRLVCRLSIPAAAKPSSMRGSSMFKAMCVFPSSCSCPTCQPKGEWRLPSMPSSPVVTAGAHTTPRTPALCLRLAASARATSNGQSTERSARSCGGNAIGSLTGAA